MTFQNVNFFTDKDCGERGTIRKFFPNTTLGLCYFHLLKNFKERLTLAEGFSKDKRKIELNKIRKIVQCSSEDEVDKIVGIWIKKIKYIF